MRNRKLIYSGLFLLLVLVMLLAAIILLQRSQELKVIFFNVGQGDAALIEQGNRQLLIDGGKNGQALLEKLGQYVPFWDRQIEAVIITHPDADHIGGLPDVFRAYQVKSVIKTNAESDSQIFQALKAAMAEEKSEIVEARNGVNIRLADGAELKIIFPAASLTAGASEDSNAGSVVARLTWREDSFLFSGDLPLDQEAVLVADDGRAVFGGPLPGRLRSRVLKVGHHGSKYSTTEEFLDSVRPEAAVISVGQNSYGHPAPEILDRLKDRGIDIWRTDEMGDITFNCLSGNLCVLVPH